MEPVFKTALGKDWETLHPVIKKHYGLVPFTEQKVTMRGVMHEVTASWYAKLVLPLARIFGALVPHTGTNIPIEVTNYSTSDGPGFHWSRLFHFPGRKPAWFHSLTVPSRSGDLLELVRFGLGPRLSVSARNGGLIMKQTGFRWKLGGLELPVPVRLLMGDFYIEEIPLTEDSFRMKMTIKHPLFGHVFSYSGSFELVE